MLMLFVILAVVVVACAPAPTPAPTAAPPTAAPKAPADPSAAAMAKLYEEAKKEGALSTIALPDDWLNYGEIKKTFFAKFPGIKYTDLDPQAGSQDEINAINANKDNKGPQNPDVVDVGFAFAPTLKNDGLCMPYKVATWDTIPTALKDPDGCWYGDYYGVFSFAVNKSVIKNAPMDWADLLKPEYKNSIAIAGDPLSSNQAQQSVYAAALANGGNHENVTPGLNFFATLAKSGNLVPVIGDQSKLAKGETPILITWDYLALGYKDILKGNPEIEVVIPKSFVFGGVYIQAINKYSPRPNAAKLWMEFLYSDEGQLLWLKGYGHPIRYDDLVKRNVIPAELAKKLPPAELYSKAFFPTGAQVSAARKLVGENWEKVVGTKIAK
ncbi:MAG: extracellular solute-binding protein [Chloroflexi bacterium]|nr:extracellular solute-binding protein [Chloroflexota bacterium]